MTGGCSLARSKIAFSKVIRRGVMPTWPQFLATSSLSQHLHTFSPPRPLHTATALTTFYCAMASRVNASHCSFSNLDGNSFVGSTINADVVLVSCKIFAPPVPSVATAGVEKHELMLFLSLSRRQRWGSARKASVRQACNVQPLQPRHGIAVSAQHAGAGPTRNHGVGERRHGSLRCW